MRIQTKRQTVRLIFWHAAEDLGVKMAELARLLKADDQEAWAAVALAKHSLDHAREIDWDSLRDLILAIVELLILLFARKSNN